VAVDVEAIGQALERERAPLAVALVIDISGSMAGAPLEHVLASCEIVADLLDARDQLAIVTFGSHAGVRCGLTRTDDAGKAAVKASLLGTRTDGNTNMHGGIEVGAGVLMTAPAGLRRAMVVLSDGQPNVGLSSPSQLAGVVASLTSIGVSSLGFGLHHTADGLAAIAAAGSGQYAYVPDPRIARVDLARAALAHGGIVADGLELVVTLGEGVELVQLLPAAPLRHGKSGVRVSIGDLFVEEGRKLALELALDLGPRATRGQLAAFALTGRSPDGASHRVTSTLDVDVRAGEAAVDLDACRAVLFVQAEAVRIEARAHADRGGAPAADAHLRAMVARIAALHGYARDDGSPLAELREQLHDEALNHERVSSDAEKMHQRKATMMAKMTRMKDLHRPSVAARLVGVSPDVAGRSFELLAETVIGRSASNEVQIAHSSLSRAHVRILFVGDRYVLQDLGSTNGALVNGARVNSADLAPGDLVQLGDVELRFELVS
jgi:Ca-activated chloride channel family protein